MEPTIARTLEPEPARSEVVERLVQMMAAAAREIPVERWLKGFLVQRVLLRWKRYRFEFTFRCKKIGVVWSAAAFPDLLTRHLLVSGFYQEDVILALQTLIRKGDAVFDVGGHHGLMAIVSSRATGAGGAVVTFEPNPLAREHLERNLRLNQVTNVRIEPIALSDQTGETEFYVQQGLGSFNSSLCRAFAQADTPGPVVTVRAPRKTLDNYVSESGITPQVIKIDVEGGEWAALTGGLEVLRRHRPILIMEFNPVSAAAAGTPLSTMEALLRGENYELLVLKRDLWGRYRFSHHEQFDEARHTRRHLVNAICVPAERLNPADPP